MSTESTVRAAIVSAIQAVAVSDLGFSNANGNVKSYLVEFQQRDEIDEYFSAAVSGSTDPQVRAWAVQVVGSDEPLTTATDETQRQYSITVRAYYELGVDGTGVNLMIDHARAVREALKEMADYLGNTVDRILSSRTTEPRLVEFPGLGVLEIATMDIQVEAEKDGPTY